MPEISVIMATYNCESTLRRAVDSIFAQTYPDWELVVCDDCSTDGTWDILCEYRRQRPDRVVLLKNEKNSKLPYSLNRCLEAARGEYIARMDGDDISLPERLEKQLNYLRAHPEYEVVGTSMLRFDDEGDYDKYEAVKDPCARTLLMQVPFCHATILMRKRAYDALNGYTVAKRTERGQDLDLWFRFYAQGFAGNNLSEALYKVCENRDAIRRRKLKYDVYATQTRKLGFRLLDFPKSKHYLVYLPLISRLVPRRLKLYRRRRLAQKDAETTK